MGQKMRKYRLTNSKLTSSVNKYIKDWRKLGEKVCSLFDGDATLMGYDPDFLIFIRTQEGSYTQYVNVDFAKRISKLIQSKKLNSKSLT